MRKNVFKIMKDVYISQKSMGEDFIIERGEYIKVLKESEVDYICYACGYRTPNEPDGYICPKCGASMHPTAASINSKKESNFFGGKSIKEQNKKWEIYTLQTEGNEEDGWKILNSHRTKDIINISEKAKSSEIVDALIEAGYLNKGVTDEDIQIQKLGLEMVGINDARTGENLLQLILSESVKKKYKEASSDYNYYFSELKKLIPVNEYGMNAIFSSNKGKTKTLNVTEDFIEAFFDFIDRYEPQNVFSESVKKNKYKEEDGNVSVEKVIKDLQGNFSKDNEAQMKGVQLLKGLATSDEDKANEFMKELDIATTEISKRILGE